MKVFHMKLPICVRRHSPWKLSVTIARWQARFLSFNRSIKIAAFLLASFVIFFFVIPHIVEFVRVHNKHFFKTKNLDACIAEKLKRHELAIAQFDTVAVHDALPHREAGAEDHLRANDAADNGESHQNANEEISSHYLAFVGNGQIGVRLCHPGGSCVGDLLVRADRTITLSTAFNPLFHVELPEYARESSLLVAFRDGLLHELSCFRKNDVCVSVERVAYVHRIHPSVLIQEVHVANPTKQAVSVRLASASKALRLEPLTASAMDTLVAFATRGTRRVYVRYGQLNLGASNGAVAVRFVLEPLVRSPTDLAALTSGAKLQLVAQASVDYGERDGRDLQVLVGAQASRSHVECTFVRSRSLLLQDVDKRKLAAEVAFLEADLNDDLLTLLPRFCRFQLALVANAVDEPDPVLFADAYAPLRAQHTLAWNALYSNGSAFEISYSKAPHALNPTRINATLFYLLGHVPLFDPSLQFNHSDTLSASLVAPHALGPHTLDACYESRVSTFAATAGLLWQPVFDLRSLAAVADAWLVTLTKKRCAPLLRNGAFGLLEAMVLSFGPFRFVNSHSGSDDSDAVHRHLELVADPNDLHRDRMHFSRLFFNEQVALSVRVELQSGSDKPFLFVHAERVTASDPVHAAPDDAPSDGDEHLHAAAKRAAYWPALTLLATDAELRQIIELRIVAGHKRSDVARFALKYTEPATALLYVAESRGHLEELRVATAVRGVREFHAHPADLISLHRDGHSFGGLPLTFWILIVALIVLFHLFLLKLIIAEFCTRKRNASANTYRRRHTSSNSTVDDDDLMPNPNMIALKRLLAEHSSSRRDSAV